MKKTLRILTASLASALFVGGLAACGGNQTTSATTTAAGSAEASKAEAKTAAEQTANEATDLTVAASVTPHAEILNACKDQLQAKGINLVVKEFDDYVLPNNATEDGEVDANYFQHIIYLNDFNEQNGTHLVSVGAIHYEPFGLYAGKSDDLDKIADGSKIAVPNDGTNEGRALLLLQDLGLIKLREDAGFTATKLDIAENPHNLDIQELEAAQIPRSLQDVDFAVINGNYAIQAGLSVEKDALAKEDAASKATEAYANVLVVKEGNEKSEAVQALLEALKSDEIKQFVADKYQGSVVLLDE